MPIVLTLCSVGDVASTAQIGSLFNLISRITPICSRCRKNRGNFTFLFYKAITRCMPQVNTILFPHSTNQIFPRFTSLPKATCSAGCSPGRGSFGLHFSLKIAAKETFFVNLGHHAVLHDADNKATKVLKVRSLQCTEYTSGQGNRQKFNDIFMFS